MEGIRTRARPKTHRTRDRVGEGTRSRRGECLGPDLEEPAKVYGAWVASVVASGAVGRDGALNRDVWNPHAGRMERADRDRLVAWWDRRWTREVEGRLRVLFGAPGGEE